LAIPNPAKLEVRSVIRFLNAKEAPAEIHCQFVSVCGELLVHETVKERLDYSKLCAR
jgi:thymidine phosphorylase